MQYSQSIHTLELVFGIVMAGFVCASASAAGMACSVRPDKAVRDAQLATLAKVSVDQARKTALRLVHAPNSSTATGELEVESGCLVYSFDIKIPQKPGVEEVMIDAGNGQVLSHRHETAAQEAAEQAKDRLAPKHK